MDTFQDMLCSIFIPLLETNIRDDGEGGERDRERNMHQWSPAGINQGLLVPMITSLNPGPLLKILFELVFFKST